MAGSSSSLVVAISADITDFSRQLDAMTKGVDKAARQLELVGDVLKVAITEKVIELGTKFLEMGADAEAAAARMQRAFGSSADGVNAAITKMTATVPATVADLQGLATHLENVAEGMGIAPQNAARMAESLLQVAANAAAVAHVPITEAVDALGASLSGRGRELIQFGIGFNQAEVKAYALTHGMLDQGNQLRETGTALSSYAIIMERAQRLNGAAAQSVNDADVQIAFLKRDVRDLGDHLASVFLPVLQDVTAHIDGMVKALSSVPDGTIKTIGGVAAVAALLIPLGIGLVKVIESFTKLRAAAALLSGGSLAGGLASAITPLGVVTLGVVGLAAAIELLTPAWDKATNALENYLSKNNHPVLAAMVAVLTGQVDRQVLGISGSGKTPMDAGLAADLARAALPTIPAAGGKNDPTQLWTKTPFDLLAENANALSKAFDLAVQHGQPIDQLVASVNTQIANALPLLDSVAGKYDLISLQNRDIAQVSLDTLQHVKDIAAVSNAPSAAAANAILGQIASRPKDIGGLGATSAVDAANKYALDLATRSAASQYATPFNAKTEATIALRNGAQSTTNDLDLRLAELGNSVNGMTPGFDAAKLAAVQYGEAQRSTQEQLSLAFETIKIKLGPLGSALDGFSAGMQNLVVNLYNAASQIGQAILSRIGGGGKNAGNGRGIGGFVGGIAGSFFGPVGAEVGSFLGTAIGGQIGSVFDHNTTAVNANTLAVTQLTESITNVPQFFKIGYYDFIASPPKPGAPLGPVNPPPSTIPFRGNPAIGGSHPDAAPSGDVHFNAPVTFSFGDIKSMSDLYAEIKQRVNRDGAIGSTSGLVFSRR